MVSVKGVCNLPVCTASLNPSAAAKTKFWPDISVLIPVKTGLDSSEAAAKVEYVLSITPAGSRKKVKVLHIDLRYGGDFKSYPRFHATMTPEFMQLAKLESSN